METEQKARTVFRITLPQRAIAAFYTWLPGGLPGGFNSMEDILQSIKRHDAYSVYSLDVFDTLLRRRVDPPEEIKRLVAEYISARLNKCGRDLSPEEILTQRDKAEQALRRRAASSGKDSQCCLDDVLTETTKAIGADTLLDCRDIVDYEIALEEEATEPMPGVRELLAYLQANGRRVVAVSETYLSLGQMTTILEHHNLLPFINRIYVSSDTGMGKATGNLFRFMITNEGINLIHIGDNHYLDKIVPRSLGIQALWFHSRDEHRRRRELRRLSAGENKLAYVNAIIGGADPREGELFRIGHDVLGPALTIFVHDVAEESKKEGVERLFFVARDGYVMKKIYGILRTTVCRDESLPIGKYVCLGRMPIRLASLDRLSCEKALAVYPYIERFRGKSTTFTDILNSFGLEPGTFAAIAGRYGVALDGPVNDMLPGTKLHALLESGDFVEAVNSRASALRGLLRDYLRDMGFMGRQNVAVVDANAEGVTQLLLDSIFACDPDYPRVIRYYLNSANLSRDRNQTEVDSPLVRGVFGDWRRDSVVKQRRLFVFGNLIELFSHPNHGLTVGYRRRNDGRVVPTFRRTPQEGQYASTSAVLQGILAYARSYGLRYDLHRCEVSVLLEGARASVEKWVTSPPKPDIEVLSNLFVVSDWPLEIESSLVRRLSFSDIVGIRGLVAKVQSAMWLEGTLATAPIPGIRSLYRIIPLISAGKKAMVKLRPPKESIPGRGKTASG